MMRKKIKLGIKILASILLVSGSFAANSGKAYASEEDMIIETSFKEVNIRKYVSDHYDSNGDGRLSETERLAAKEFILNGESFDEPGPLTSIDELKYFPNLEHLEIRYNTKLFDSIPVVSQLKSLSYIDCSGCGILGLDTGKLSNLKYLDCTHSGIMSLDLSKNNNLEKLICSNTYMLYITMGKHPNLTEIDCSNCYMKAYFDLTGCTMLKSFYGKNLSISSMEGVKNIDFSNCKFLEYIDCSDSSLSDLDVSNNPELKYLDCSSSSVYNLTLKNSKLEYLNCVDAPLKRVDIRNCPLLLENIEERVMYNCALINGDEPIIDETIFPDEQFRQYVIDKVDEDKNMMLDDWEISNVRFLHFSGSLGESKGFKSLEGIGLFTELERIYCNYNELTELDVSKNTKLKVLECSNNKLTKLDLASNKSLNELDCSYNMIKELDLSNNQGLGKLYCSNNSLGRLDVTCNTYLKEINCEKNQIIELNFGKNKSLAELNCMHNNISVIDICECQELLKNVAFRVKADPSVKIITSPEERDDNSKDDDSKKVTKIFKDVIENQWYVDATQFVYDRKIMNGVSETSFGTNMILTREQFITVLYNMEGTPETKYKPIFDDVADQTLWYAKAVTWAFNNDITSGVGNHMFGTGKDITREQLATLLYNYALQKEEYKLSIDENAVANFSDANKIDSWASDGMKWAITNGVMSGKKGKDGQLFLDPLGKATRAECAQMIKNLKENAVK